VFFWLFINTDQGSVISGDKETVCKIAGWTRLSCYFDSVSKLLIHSLIFVSGKKEGLPGHCTTLEIRWSSSALICYSSIPSEDQCKQFRKRWKLSRGGFLVCAQNKSIFQKPSKRGLWCRCGVFLFESRSPMLPVPIGFKGNWKQSTFMRLAMDQKGKSDSFIISGQFIGHSLIQSRIQFRICQYYFQRRRSCSARQFIEEN